MQLVATIVLARLLTPGDFGLVAMVTTFSLLPASFGLSGFTEAVLQRKQIDRALASNLFWISLGAGFILTIGFCAAASLLARFYRDPQVAQVAVAVSPTIFITSTSVLPLTLLSRAMRFTSVSANSVISRGLSVVVSVVLAWSGWGYWALVAGLITEPLVASIGAWSLCRWIPSLPRRARGTASVLRFAMHVYGRTSFNYFGRNIDNLLVGWRFGSGPLGFYKKAYDLFVLPVSQLGAPMTPVAVSALSRLIGNPVRFRRCFLGALGIMAFVGMGLSGDLTLVGRDLIRLVLGTQWSEAGRIFMFFGPGIGFMFIIGTNAWIHLSIGRPDRWFRSTLAIFVVTSLLFFLGLRWGAKGVASAWTMSLCLVTLPTLWYAGRPIQLGLRPMFGAIWRYVLASVLAGCVSFAIVLLLRPLVAVPGVVGAATRIGVNSALFGILYLGIVILLHRGCEPLYRITRLLREMISVTNSRGRTVEALIPETAAHEAFAATGSVTTP